VVIVVVLLFRNGNFKHFIPVFPVTKMVLGFRVVAIPFKTSVSGIV
jgi:hypothetical protein